MNRSSTPFKWRYNAPDVILLCVRWYCRYQLSYRDVEEMMREEEIIPEWLFCNTVRKCGIEVHPRI
jgi:transposase-like protein